MSISNERTTTGEPPTTAGKLTSDGKRVFRMSSPRVLWWCWIGLIVISLGDVAIQGHEFVSLKVAFGGLAITGLVYACTFWPVVIADEAGLTVRNPLRSFHIPWGAVRGIYLADSVEVKCARGAPKKDKTVYAWALSSPRRARARAQLRAWQWDQGKSKGPSGYGSMPMEAKSLVKMTTAEIMARELAAMSDEANFKSVVQDVDLDADAIRREEAGATSTAPQDASADQPEVPEVSADGLPKPAEIIAARWAWQPMLAMLVPAAAFIICLIVQ